MSEGLREWKRGWPVVLAAAGGMLVVASPSSITGLVMAPLERDFGWSRAEVTANLAIMTLCGLVFGPIVGGLVVRHGVRKVALTGFLTTTIGFALVAASGPAAWTWYVAWVVYGALSLAMGPVVYGPAISSIFDRQRGLALSFGLSGSGLAFAIWPMLLTPVLAAHSWRWAYLSVIAVALLVILPINLLALRVLKQGGQAAADGGGGAEAGTGWGLTLSETLRTGLFWRMAGALLISSAVNGSLVIHFYPILVEKGFAAGDAAFFTALIGPSLIAGRIISGWLVDRLFAPFVGAAVLALPAVTVVVLMGAPGHAAMTVGAVALGLSTGAASFIGAYLVGRYFGLRHYPGILGVLFGMFGFAFSFVPVLIGHFHDTSGTYAPLLPGLMVALVPIVVLLLTLGRYPQAPGTAGAAAAG